MTKDAIINEARMLPADERQQVAETLWNAGEEAYELTRADKVILDARLKKMREHPETSISYEELRAKLFSSD